MMGSSTGASGHHAAVDVDVLELLAAARRDAARRLAEAQSEIAAIVSASEHANADDEHDPEGATIAFERARVAALLAQAEADLTEIDAALARQEDGTLGICAACGGPIPPERLAARPAARTCVACAAVARRLR